MNNAGIGAAPQPIGEYDIAAWDRVRAVDLDGVFYGLRYEIPAMVAAGGGAIVNMASVLGWSGWRRTLRTSPRSTRSPD